MLSNLGSVRAHAWVLGLDTMLMDEGLKGYNQQASASMCACPMNSSASFKDLAAWGLPRRDCRCWCESRAATPTS